MTNIRAVYTSYLLLAMLLFGSLNLPEGVTQELRSFVLFADGRFSTRREDELLRLSIENRKLKEDLEEVRQWLLSEARIEARMKKLEGLRADSPFYKRRIQELLRILDQEASLVEAKVIFRDPAFWASGFWINKGESDNRTLGRRVIAKNSPVLVSDVLIGVVERVEEHRSYVRLITDAALTPAVRATRGDNAVALHLMTQLEEQISEGPLLQELQKSRQALEKEGEVLYLAKGELRGSSHPAWRSRSHILTGVGFNYEFSDAEGEARTLHEKGPVPLLQVGDALITSGLDGIFPAGLLVAQVTKIFPLREGDFSYTIEANWMVHDAISYVQVYPPL